MLRDGKPRYCLPICSADALNAALKVIVDGAVNLQSLVSVEFCIEHDFALSGLSEQGV